MNNFLIKQEDQQALYNLQIPKQISMFPSQYSNMIQFQKETMIIQKFLKALHNLQVAQSQLYNSPKYPFVIQVQNNQFLVYPISQQVHLGKTQFDRNNMFEHIYPPQCYYVPQYAQVISQYPKLKLHIQKKRQVRLMQDQKDTKNIPKNYCKSIITFACKNQQNLCIRILKDQVKVVKFINKISQYKKQLLNIRVFSALLQRSEDPEEEEYRQAFRIIRYHSESISHKLYIQFKNCSIQLAYEIQIKNIQGYQGSQQFFSHQEFVKQQPMNFYGYQYYHIHKTKYIQKVFSTQSILVYDFYYQQKRLRRNQKNVIIKNIENKLIVIEQELRGQKESKEEKQQKNQFYDHYKEQNKFIDHLIDIILFYYQYLLLSLNTNTLKLCCSKLTKDKCSGHYTKSFTLYYKFNIILLKSKIQIFSIIG